MDAVTRAETMWKIALKADGSVEVDYRLPANGSDSREALKSMTRLLRQRVGDCLMKNGVAIKVGAEASVR